MEIEGCSDKQIRDVTQDKLWACKFLWSLVKRPPRTFGDLFEHAIEESKVEDYRKVKTQKEEAEQKQAKRKNDDRAFWPNLMKSKFEENNQKPNNFKKFNTFTPLKISREQILMEIKENSIMRYPRRLKGNLNTQNRTTYCEFHKDQGHTTNNCYQLREQIKNLI